MVVPSASGRGSEGGLPLDPGEAPPLSVEAEPAESLELVGLSACDRRAMDGGGRLAVGVDAASRAAEPQHAEQEA